MPHPPGPAATPPPHTPASNPPDPRAWRVRTGLELCRSLRLCRFHNMAVHPRFRAWTPVTPAGWATLSAEMPLGPEVRSLVAARRRNRLERASAGGEAHHQQRPGARMPSTPRRSRAPQKPVSPSRRRSSPHLTQSLAHCACAAPSQEAHVARRSKRSSSTADATASDQLRRAAAAAPVRRSHL